MEDMRGFGDITDEEEAAVRAGSLQVLKPLSSFGEWLDGSPFIVYLGGPATGLVQLLDEDPAQLSFLTAIFAQFGLVGDVKTMEAEGRNPQAQFNVLLAPVAAARLIDICRQHRIPFYFLPTNVTRLAEIGLGIPALGEGLFDSSHVGFLQIQNLRKKWYESAIEKRDGELLLDHDLACLVMYLQVTGEIQPVYEVHRAIPAITAHGPRAGVTHFLFKGEAVDESCFHVATRLLSRKIYFEVLNRTIRSSGSKVDNQVVLSTSLSPAEMADEECFKRFEARLIELLLPRLRAGATIHWGSHPSAARVMTSLAGFYPKQIVQHLWSKFPGNRIEEIPDQNVHLYDTLADLRLGLITNKDQGLFIAGRTDGENLVDSEEDDDAHIKTDARSGVVAEYHFFVLCNPKAEAILDSSPGGEAGMLAVAMRLARLEREYSTVEQFLSPV